VLVVPSSSPILVQSAVEVQERHEHIGPRQSGAAPHLVARPRRRCGHESRRRHSDPIALEGCRLPPPPCWRYIVHEGGCKYGLTAQATKVAMKLFERDAPTPYRFVKEASLTEERDSGLGYHG
jgi:hypothetical protein